MIYALPIVRELCDPPIPRISVRSRSRWKGYLHQLDSRCYWCNREVSGKNSTLDHIIPQSRGGLDAPANLVLCCNRCNGIKASLTIEEFLNVLEAMAASVRNYVFTETAATG